MCCSYLPMSYPPTGPGPGPDSSLSDLVHGYTSTRRQATAPDNMAQAHLRNVEAEQQKQQVILRSLSDECAQVTSLLQTLATTVDSKLDVVRGSVSEVRERAVAISPRLDSVEERAVAAEQERAQAKTELHTLGNLIREMQEQQAAILQKQVLLEDWRTSGADGLQKLARDVEDLGRQLSAQGAAGAELHRAHQDAFTQLAHRLEAIERAVEDRPWAAA